MTAKEDRKSAAQKEKHRQSPISPSILCQANQKGINTGNRKDRRLNSESASHSSGATGLPDRPSGESLKKAFPESKTKRYLQSTGRFDLHRLERLTIEKTKKARTARGEIQKEGERIIRIPTFGRSSSEFSLLGVMNNIHTFLQAADQWKPSHAG